MIIAICSDHELTHDFCGHNHFHILFVKHQKKETLEREQIRLVVAEILGAKVFTGVELSFEQNWPVTIASMIGNISS